MVEPLVDQIMQKIDQAAELYHRLLLVVGPSGAGKTSALRAVRKHIEAPLININLELCKRMLDMTERQRMLQLPTLIGEIINEAGKNVVLLDNIEILFDISLKQEPLRLLQGISRNRTVVATWNGFIDSGTLIYAVPEHHEYRRYPVRDFLIASSDAVS